MKSEHMATKNVFSQFMLWSIDSCQNRVSADQNQLIVSRAKRGNSASFYRLGRQTFLTMVTLYVQFLCSDWSKFDRSSCGTFMQHLKTCLLIAEAGRVLSLLEMFLTLFFTGCPKLNTGDIKILLLFMAGLFNIFLFCFVFFFVSKSSEIRFPMSSFSKLS